MQGCSVRIIQLLAVVCVLVLTACASAERDTRYMHSEQRPALKIPAGMATPDYNMQMAIPGGIKPVDASQIDSSFDAERPPQLDDTH